MNARRESAQKRKKGREMDQRILIWETRKKNAAARIPEETKGSFRYPLLTYQELPDYMKDNEFIINYYRANWPLKQALLSVFRWHNETLNIWTHLVGFALFLGLTISNLKHVPHVATLVSKMRSFPLAAGENASHQSVLETPELIDLKYPWLPVELPVAVPLGMVAVEWWPFYVFLMGSMFCLLSSSLCHLFSCHSHLLNLLLIRLDYAGITAMIVTSFFPPIYYLFQCTPVFQLIYLGGITVMGLFTILTLLSPTLSSGKFRSFRAFLFVSMGLFGTFPAAHAVLANWGEPRRNVTLAYESTMAVSYLLGTGFYVSRVPERWKPGWFDLAGHSHQIFHVFVIAGALAHYGAALVFLEYGGRVRC